jgi:hypothetical protein
MTKEEMRDKVVQLMMVKRFHCSQAVLAVGQEKLGKKDDEVMKAMRAFGGGLGETEKSVVPLSGRWRLWG